jgi:hypothetical protein
MKVRFLTLTFPCPNKTANSALAYTLPNRGVMSGDFILAAEAILSLVALCLGYHAYWRYCDSLTEEDKYQEWIDRQ